MNAANHPDQAQLAEQLGGLITGYWRSQAIYVAAKLGLADLLQTGPMSVETLAGTTGTHGPSLFRLLRALASIGIFAEDTDGRFRLTALAELLQSGVSNSQRALS